MFAKVDDKLKHVGHVVARSASLSVVEVDDKLNQLMDHQTDPAGRRECGIYVSPSKQVTVRINTLSIF